MATVGGSGALSEGMVRLSVSLTAASARSAQELLDALRFLVMSTRLEQGCLGCSAWTDPDGTVRCVEEWATEHDMQRRVKSERFTSLLSVIESAKDAQVQFDFVTRTRGIEYVAQVRETPAT